MMAENVGILCSGPVMPSMPPTSPPSPPPPPPKGSGWWSVRSFVAGIGVGGAVALIIWLMKSDAEEHWDGLWHGELPKWASRLFE